MMLFRNLLKGREEFGKRIQTSKSTFITFLNTQQAQQAIVDLGKLITMKTRVNYIQSKLIFSTIEFHLNFSI